MRDEDPPSDTPQDTPSLGPAPEGREGGERETDAIIAGNDILKEFDAFVKAYNQDPASLPWQDALSTMSAALDRLCRTCTGDNWFGMAGLRFPALVNALGAIQAMVDLDEPSQVRLLGDTLFHIGAKCNLIETLAMRGSVANPRLPGEVRAFVEHVSQVSLSIKRQNDRLKEHADAVKRADVLVSKLPWRDVNDTIVRLETIRDLTMTSMPEKQVASYLVRATKVYLPSDADADLMAFKRHLSERTYVAPETFKDFCVGMRRFESVEKRIANAIKVYELVMQRHDFAGPCELITLNHRVSEIDELLSRTHVDQRDLDSIFHRHLPSDVYHTCTDLHYLLKNLLDAWGLRRRCSTEFRSDLETMAKQYADDMKLPRLVGADYVAGTLRRLFVESGMRAKINGVAATMRSEGSVRRNAIGSTGAPVLVAQADQDSEASDSEDLLHHPDVDEPELLAVALAELSCDCCGHKGHRVAQCPQAKQTIDTVIETIRSQVMVTTPPTSHDRLLNAVRATMNLPFPNHRRSSNRSPRFRRTADGNRATYKGTN